MACNKSFSSNYMLLDPNDVGFFDLIHILISNNLEKRKFVDSSDDKEDDFQRRWLIFLSIVVQKLLQFVSKPMAVIGWAIEMFLNFLSINGCSLHGLLLNLLRGKIIVPDSNSETFLSFIGNLDKRVKLDSRIKPGDGKYNAALSVMASKLSYENHACIKTTVQDHWKMEFVGFYDFWNEYQGKATTQAFMLRDRSRADHDTIVVAFRGTEPFDADAWCSDFDISWYELEGGVNGKIHGGFMKALGLQKNIGWPKKIEQDDKHPLAYYAVRDMLKKLLSENDKARYIITGHSLGGALAILFPAILALHEENKLLEKLEGVYTFGQPRVGDKEFGQYMENEVLKEHNVRYFRFVYSNDMVPRLPYDDKALMFKHFGTCLYYNRNYEAQILPEEPNKNYFSPSVQITMMVNAFYELTRSFTIPNKYGPDYAEGYFFRLFRLSGLLMPGASAHCPQDYVNLTRLGPSDVFVLPKPKQL
ncbi:triacylglycerol lipase OBL1-like isoform X1 [Rosa rugosa]|uniref:triacylglycerol lipase OBL1-like isoform X1 n=1 Tax=Rosa rugosa TaxID=74645 RepID=UPI002B40BD31|nr:triacylglycerol lipase OBL1-like isoform X1 [Rosa rugosa]